MRGPRLGSICVTREFIAETEVVEALDGQVVTRAPIALSGSHWDAALLSVVQERVAVAVGVCVARVPGG